MPSYIQMNSLSWYINLYYKFRDYPIPEINASYKSNELRALYSGMLKKQFTLFQLDNRRDGEIQGIISKNNYDHMLNKKAESNLEQEEALPTQHVNDEPQIDSRSVLSRPSISSMDRTHLQRDSEVSLISQESRWLVQAGPNEKNMDVFYELMIKMIRISLRRLTIEAFAFDQYARTLSKEGIQDAIKNNAEYAQLYNKIYAQDKNIRQSEGEDPATIEHLTFPASVEELKYEFLKYCISCKVYNTPQPKQEASSKSISSISQSESQHSSIHEPSSHSHNQQQEEGVRKQAKGLGQNEIESLILRVSQGQTCVFNQLMEVYLQQIRRNGNNQIEILGIKDIAHSVFEMATGKPNFHTATNSLGINRNRFRRGIFDEHGEYARDSDALSNSNLILATWLDLILFKEKPVALYDIVERLVSLGDKNSYLASMTPADKLGHSEKFYMKLSSYLHLLILNSTKNLFAQSLSKVNYLLVLAQDVLGDTPNQPKRPFKDIRLKRFQCKVDGQTRSYEAVKVTYDCSAKRQLWKQQAVEVLLGKWKIIANAITQVCVRNSKAFFAAIFERCVQMLDEQLSLQVELANQLMEVSEGIGLEGQIKQRQGEKCESIRRGVHQIVREIMGVMATGSFGGEEGQDERLLGINSFASSRSDRYREGSFVGREQSAQQLGKWCEIMSENIYIFKQYRENLQQVGSLFRHHHIYMALWFNKFHSETKILIRKLGRPRLERVLSKFLKETPLLWESMNSEREQKRVRNRLKRNEKSKFRNRISSIKTEAPLSLTEKKAIVLNYMLKAELELYSHYTHIDLLNGQHRLQLFEKEIAKKEHSTRPRIFAHPLIAELLLFPPEEHQHSEGEPRERKGRQDCRHMTSNFAVPTSFVEIENTRTLNNIEKCELSPEVEEVMRAMAELSRAMNIQLQLKDGWKERFGDLQVGFLGEATDYLRYLNEINYLYEFWAWTDHTNNKDQSKKQHIQLLNGMEFQADLDTLDAYFRELKGNAQYLSQLQLMRGETQKLVADEQLSEMLKRLKIHNKELYMINETIIEAENYFKLLGANLIGRNRDELFRALLNQAITTYKNNKREKPSLRMLEKSQDTHMESLGLRNTSQQMQSKQGSTQGLMSRDGSMGRLMKRAGSFLSHFEFTPEYYKIQSKIVRVNCLISSFEVDNSIYKNIKSFRVLSRERLERLAIIGGRYYDRLEELIGPQEGELLISEELLVRTKNIYQKKLLLFLNTLINLNYHSQGRTVINPDRNRQRTATTRREFSNIPEEHVRGYKAVLKKYADILRRFIYCKVRENIKRMEERERFEEANSQGDKKEAKDRQGRQGRQFSICRFIEEILELSEKKEEFGEESLLGSLEGAIEKEANLKFCQQFKRELQAESLSLQAYKAEEEKVDYLRKRLSYLLMREMYFTLNYDNEFLQEKSMNSKRNYAIYQQRINSFYEEIIQLDYQEYMERKEEQLKKRSVHLKDYEFKYERQPNVAPLEKNLNQLICCLFNQLLNTYTSSTEYKMFTRRHKPLTSTNHPHNLFTQYCASEYSKKPIKEHSPKEKSREKPKSKSKSKHKRDRKHNHEQKDSITSIFAQIFQMKLNSQSEEHQENQVEENERVTVLVYTEEKFQLSQSIKAYLSILNDYEYTPGGNCKNKGGIRREICLTGQQPITEMQLQIIRLNERSLITMLKSDFLQKINEAKCTLIRKNLIANIQKLYINLDVRHKVFESFKDRILNYQMQKTKIYHQYMDYIRGLKLDVYSHMAGEQSLPYIKIIHAVKLYRLQVKKMELEQRVNQEFQKNLQKWNVGIQQNMAAYDQWLQQEEAHWEEQQQKYLAEKKSLFEIFHAVSKEMARQNRIQKQKNNSSSKPKRASCEPSSKTVSSVEVEEFKPPLFTPTSSKNLKSLAKKSITKQRQLFEDNKSIQRSEPQLIKVSSSAAILNNYAFTESTKPQTKYDKPTIIQNRSQSGLRGLSIKFDPSRYLEQQGMDRADHGASNGRKTEAAQQTMKVSDLFKKKQKRYLSAQKHRPTNQNY